MGGMLRVGGDLQPRPAGSRRGARTAQGREPRRHGRRSHRGRQPGLRDPDRGAYGERHPDLPPDDAARPFHPREPTVTLDIAPTADDRLAEVLSDDALAFVGELHGRFGARRNQLLQARSERGAPSGFLEETQEIREGDWQVAPPRDDYADRRVEITGPTDRKLVINALNSGARGFMADFEDANSPTWRNQVEGHVNLMDAIEGTITYDSSEGKHYELVANPATLLV